MECIHNDLKNLIRCIPEIIDNKLSQNLLINKLEFIDNIFHDNKIKNSISYYIWDIIISNNIKLNNIKLNNINSNDVNLNSIIMGKSSVMKQSILTILIQIWIDLGKIDNSIMRTIDTISFDDLIKLYKDNGFKNLFNNDKNIIIIEKSDKIFDNNLISLEILIMIKKYYSVYMRPILILCTSELINKKYTQDITTLQICHD